MRFLKSIILLLLLCLTVPQNGIAQNARTTQDSSQSARSGSSSNNEEEDPCVQIDDQRYCWTLDPITNIMHLQVPDTCYIGLGNRQTMMGKSLGLVHTGNLYSPHLINNFFDRRDAHDFIFVNAYSLFAHRPEDVLIYNTKLPYTTAAYYTSGSNMESNDHLKLDFAGNLNRKMGIGTFLDYVYARGEYTSQATKPLKWTSYLYYLDDQYKATLTYNIQKLGNQENGGILDPRYVTNPDSLSKTFTDPRTMPTKLIDTWNDMDSWNLHFNHSYDLGMWDDYTDPADSTNVLERFTSVASIFHSFDIESYDHRFMMERGADQTDASDFYKHHYYNKDFTADTTSYSSFSTYAGMRINEGFSRWSQFGLSAFVGYQHQSYKTTPDSLGYNHSSNNLFIGGQLSRHQSSLLTFDITAKVGLIGDKKGDIDITGQLQTVIPVGKDSITIQGSGFLRNQSLSYMLQRYTSNHFMWENSFDKEQHLHLEGKLNYSLSGTEAKVGIEHISNYHYFDAKDFLPKEYDGELEQFSIELSQHLHWKVFNWDNKVLFQSVLQTTDDPAVLSVPRITWQSDFNLRFCIAHALTTQMGIVGTYFTKYHAPLYQPATQQFTAQNDVECGGYPLFNAYVNCNLKRIKFYIMYSGFGSKLFSNNVFLMPYYPLQSTRIEYGVTFDLQN